MNLQNSIPSFLNYFIEYNDEQNQNYDTHTKFKSVIKWLERYRDHLKLTDILMSDITAEFVKSFKKYLETTPNQYKKLSAQKSTDKYVQIFRSVWKHLDTYGKHLFKYNIDPFKGIKFVETDRKDKEKLDIAEYERLKALDKERILIEFYDEKNINNTIDYSMEVRNRFILCLMWGGMRVGDSHSLKWKNFFQKTDESGKGATLCLSWVSYKTKIVVEIEMPKPAFIFIKYFVIKEMERLNYLGGFKEWTESLKKEDNDLILGALIMALATEEVSKDRLVFLRDEQDNILFKNYNPTEKNKIIAKRKHSLSVPINTALKRLAKYAKIKCTLKTHVGRHSNAQFLAESGVSAFEIMANMGHGKITTSQGYVNRLNGIDASRKINKKVKY